MNSSLTLIKIKALMVGGLLLLVVFLVITERENLEPVLTPVPIPQTQFVVPKNILARAVLVYDLTTQQTLFAKQADRPLPTASLSKVMTALLATENLNATSTVALSEDFFSLTKLINLTLLASINDGAEALAMAVEQQTGKNFVETMNRRARELGLEQTFFLDASGLDWSTNLAGGYSSARDLATLFSYIVEQEPALLEATKETGLIIKSGTGQLYFPANTNKAASAIPDLLASKTGSTDLAGGNLVTVFDRGLNQPVIIVVLGSTLDGRFADTTTLAQATLEYFAKNAF
ncbi:MAG: hypothetical protein AAB589_02625 [Patescibacteria group bacterium]